MSREEPKQFGIVKYAKIGNSTFLRYKSFSVVNIDLCRCFRHCEYSYHPPQPGICFEFSEEQNVYWTFETKEERDFVASQLGIGVE